VDNSRAAVQQLDVGESADDVLTVTTADGTTHSVTVTVHGSEDAAVISGDTSRTVGEDGILSVSGTLTITDVDASDNPIDFPDEASTLGDSGYGSFQLTGGAWSYALNNAHAAVQGLDAGVTLQDSHTFVASDGSTQVVTVVIQGVDETVATVVIEPPAALPEPTPRPIDVIEPPPLYEAPVEPEVAGEKIEEPAQPEYLPGMPQSPNTLLGEPLQPDEIFLSVINDIRPDRSGVANDPSSIEKPDEESAQTFLQELKSFWKEDSTAASIEMSEVRFSQDFWNDVDQMAKDMEESVEEQERKTQLSAEAAAGVGISLTAGFVSWALRAGSMAASFLAAMPTWRHFDPMPILSEDRKRNQTTVADDEEGRSEEDEQERAVQELLEKD
jgi:VCBS repeat-containing protein